MTHLDDGFTRCWHRCPGGTTVQPLLFTMTANGYVEWPVFAKPSDNSPTGRIMISHCPECGVRLNLNDCYQLAELPCNGCPNDWCDNWPTGPCPVPCPECSPRCFYVDHCTLPEDGRCPIEEWEVHHAPRI